MPYKFNPLTGKLDNYESASHYKTYEIVDAAFLIDKEIELTVEPSLDSEFVFLNGLILGDDCYNIVGTTLTFLPALPFKLGSVIDVRYSA